MDLLAGAVQNNVEWCELVAGGGRADPVTGLWVVDGDPPALFPAAVTLRPRVSAENVVAALSGKDSCSVKDSYADLDLEPHGFRELFSAQWIGLAPGQPSTRSPAWFTVTGPDDLESWCAAAELPDVLPVRLLTEPAVRILAAQRDGRPVAGAIANRSDEVVGVSNVFQADYRPLWVWSDIVAAIAEHFPAVPIVGYEHGTDLDAAIAAGFSARGPLRIWVRQHTG